MQINFKIIIAFIVMIAVVAAVGFFVFSNPSGRNHQTTPTPTATPTPTVSNPADIIPGVRPLLYENKEFGFYLWYPEGSNLKENGFEGFLHATAKGVGAVGIFLSDSLFQGTNLNEAAVVVGVSSDAEALGNCKKAAADQGEQDRGTADIGGESFYVFESTGAAAGNLYESRVYRTIHNGSCYEIVETLHSGNIGNYPAGTVTEFDKAKFSGILENIVKTFVFTEEAGSGVIGLVNVGPICPVQSATPDPQCEPRPYETSITITKEGFSKQVDTDSEGKFRVDLDPGTYSFSAKSGTTFPRCAPVSVEVKPKIFTPLTITCDTGIR